MAQAAAAAAKKKIVVLGGNGFLGSHICAAAVSRGWHVTSISRNGPPPSWSSIHPPPHPPAWSDKVTWARGDAFDPSTYTKHLEGASAVVHSMGILLETMDYKRVVRGEESPVGWIRSMASGSGGENPLEKEQREERDGKRAMTYEKMNCESALLLARAAQSHHVPAFAYISASSAPIFLPSRYLASKRHAESELATSFPSMRTLFFRPSLLYSSARPLTLALGGLARVGSVADGLLGGRLQGLMGAGVERPMEVGWVAQAVVGGLESEESEEGGAVTGVVDEKGMERLVERVWRKGML